MTQLQNQNRWRPLARFPATGLCIAGLVWMLVFVVATACRKSEAIALRRPVAAATDQASVTCLPCHREIFEVWAATDHALANRPVAPDRDRELLTGLQRAGGTGLPVPAMLLGHHPLSQPLVPQAGGRWQAFEQAIDAARGDWFRVFGDEVRHPGEWGHWTGRGMNWNSMCADCHMTGYQKNYDVATDSYHSTWVEQGVGCIQCHGALPDNHAKLPAAKVDRNQAMQTCASCHARQEQLTGNFQPGDNYSDHYRVELLSEPALFHPDGQQRDEVFTWTSLLQSRMGHAGVTCLDCHDPHTTKTVRPAADNSLCLQCHAAPGRVLAGGARAVVIDPTTHSHHAEGSAGNSCIACHMPTTTYMQRAPRHDHGWLKPDPLLTKELGIPNACSRCHENGGVDKMIAATNAWYGEKMDSRQRTRARAIAAAQAGKPGSADALLALLANEDIPIWRASYLALLGNTTGTETATTAAARAALSAKDPLERSRAVSILGARGADRETLRPLLRDPSRLVRLDAAWVLSPELATGSAERRELDSYLNLTSDQPIGRSRLGADLANRGQRDKAEADFRLAATWDPLSADIREMLATLLSNQGKPAEAAAKFMEAAALDTANSALPYQAALAYAEAGRTGEAETALRLAVSRDPKFARAHYNLGLLLAQGDNRLAAAVASLGEAERLSPGTADYPYALATVLWRMGDKPAARAAAQRVLQLAPNHPGARQLLQAP